MENRRIPYYLDDEDYLIILSLGRDKISQTKIQKISYILSKLTNYRGNFTAHEYGNFSETIMEKIEAPINRNIYNVYDNTYSLTPEGLEIYNAITQKLDNDLGHENFVENMELLDILRKMSSEELEIITYYLFPEITENSKIKERINNLISLLKSKSKVKAGREGNNVTLTIE